MLSSKDVITAICSMVSSGPMPNNPELVINRIKKISSDRGYFSIINRFVVESSMKWFFIDEIDESKDMYRKDVLIFAASEKRFYMTGKNKQNVILKIKIMIYLNKNFGIMAKLKQIFGIKGIMNLK